ncbi:prepilin-type N-terminal cleavage/methylation domain-containing protein [Persephonella sp.]
MKDKKGFTLLELLLVVTLILITFSVIGISYISNLKDSINLSSKISRYTQYLSVNNQLSKQIFAKIEIKPQNFQLDRDRISFYTLYPIFYSGAVRAEYRIKKLENGRYILVYEEFPYIDGKLGWEGLKKITLGNFEKISFFVIQNGRIYENYSRKNFPQIIKMVIDDETFYITAGYTR